MPVTSSNILTLNHSTSRRTSIRPRGVRGQHAPFAERQAARLVEIFGDDRRARRPRRPGSSVNTGVVPAGFICRNSVRPLEGALLDQHRPPSRIRRGQDARNANEGTRGDGKGSPWAAVLTSQMGAGSQGDPARLERTTIRARSLLGSASAGDPYKTRSRLQTITIPGTSPAVIQPCLTHVKGDAMDLLSRSRRCSWGSGRLHRISAGLVDRPSAPGRAFPGPELRRPTIRQDLRRADPVRLHPGAALGLFPAASQDCAGDAIRSRGREISRWASSSPSCRRRSSGRCCTASSRTCCSTR